MRARHLLPVPARRILRRLVDRHRHRIPNRVTGARHDRIPVPGPVEFPVVLLVATGCDPDRLLAVDDHLAGCHVRLVWLVDTDEPDVLSSHVVEWLAPADSIQRAGFDPTTVRSARLAAIALRYGPQRVVFVPPEGALPDRVLVGFPTSGGAGGWAGQ